MKTSCYALLFLGFFLISQTLAAAARAKPVISRSIAAETTTAPAGSLWIGKSDQSTSCNTQKALSLEETAKELKTAGIKYSKQKKVYDNKMHIAMCGADKGIKNSYLISAQDETKAVSLGFEKL